MSLELHSTAKQDFSFNYFITLMALAFLLLQKEIQRLDAMLFLWPLSPWIFCITVSYYKQSGRKKEKACIFQKKGYISLTQSCEAN